MDDRQGIGRKKKGDGKGAVPRPLIIMLDVDE